MTEEAPPHCEVVRSADDGDDQHLYTACGLRIHFYFFTQQALYITQFTPYSGEKPATQACLADDDHISHKSILEDKAIGKCLVKQFHKVM